jgi:hypothetical protein
MKQKEVLRKELSKFLFPNYEALFESENDFFPLPPADYLATPRAKFAPQGCIFKLNYNLSVVILTLRKEFYSF